MNWSLSTAPQLSSLAGNCKVYLPAGDAQRELRLQRELCSSNYPDDPKAGIKFANQFIQQAALQQQPLTLSHFYLCRAGHYGNSNQLAEQEADLTRSGCTGQTQ